VPARFSLKLVPETVPKFGSENWPASKDLVKAVNKSEPLFGALFSTRFGSSFEPRVLMFWGPWACFFRSSSVPRAQVDAAVDAAVDVDVYVHVDVDSDVDVR